MRLPGACRFEGEAKARSISPLSAGSQCRHPAMPLYCEAIVLRASGAHIARSLADGLAMWLNMRWGGTRSDSSQLRGFGRTGPPQRFPFPAASSAPDHSRSQARCGSNEAQSAPPSSGVSAFQLEIPTRPLFGRGHRGSRARQSGLRAVYRCAPRSRDPNSNPAGRQQSHSKV